MPSIEVIEINEKLVQAPCLEAFKGTSGKAIMRMPYWHRVYQHGEPTLYFDFIHSATDATWLKNKIEAGDIFIREKDYEQHTNRSG